jgi:hypothetical protein
MTKFERTLTLNTAKATAFGSIYTDVKALRDPEGVVHLQGLLKPVSVTTNQLLFTLPVDCRPDKLAILQAFSKIGTVRLDANPDGNVFFVEEAGRTLNDFLSLDGVSFTNKANAVSPEQAAKYVADNFLVESVSYMGETTDYKTGMVNVVIRKDIDTTISESTLVNLFTGAFTRKDKYGATISTGTIPANYGGGGLG